LSPSASFAGGLASTSTAGGRSRCHRFDLETPGRCRGGEPPRASSRGSGCAGIQGTAQHTRPASSAPVLCRCGCTRACQIHGCPSDSRSTDLAPTSPGAPRPEQSSANHLQAAARPQPRGLRRGHHLEKARVSRASRQGWRGFAEHLVIWVGRPRRRSSLSRPGSVVMVRSTTCRAGPFSRATASVAGPGHCPPQPVHKLARQRIGRRRLPRHRSSGIASRRTPAAPVRGRHKQGPHRHARRGGLQVAAKSKTRAHRHGHRGTSACRDLQAIESAWHSNRKIANGLSTPGCAV